MQHSYLNQYTEKVLVDVESGGKWEQEREYKLTGICAIKRSMLSFSC